MFELCAVGDIGLKSGWVRCRHGAGRGGGGAVRVGLGDTMVQVLLLAPEIPSVYLLTNYKYTLIQSTNSIALRNHQGRYSNVLDKHANVNREKGV